MSFINPYNFVSVGSGKKKQDIKEYRKTQETFTGKIHCRLTPKTPIIIPNTSTDRAFQESDNFAKEHPGNKKDKHTSYEFFSYEDLSTDEAVRANRKRNDGPKAPVIPGSQLRGVIRSAYETVTNSCFSAVNGDTIVSRRVGEAKKPGILKWNADGELELWDAKTYKLEIYNSVFPPAKENLKNKVTKIYKAYDKKSGEDGGEYVAFYKLQSSLKKIIEECNGETAKLAEETLELKKDVLDDMGKKIFADSKNRKNIELNDKIIKLYHNQEAEKYFFVIKEGDLIEIDTNGDNISYNKNKFFSETIIRDKKTGNSKCNIVKPVAPIVGKPPKGIVHAYFHFGEIFGTKLEQTHESLFEVGKIRKTLTDKEWEQHKKRIKQVLELYDDPLRNTLLDKKKDTYMKHKGHDGYRKAFQKFINKEITHICVYYDFAGAKQEQLYLSPAQITKEVYANQIADVLQDYKPCCDSNHICPACALFGKVDEKGGKTKISSRVRFTDAYWDEGTKLEYNPPVTLPILGSPKPSAAEFYLKKPAGAATYWNYDYYTKMDGKSETKAVQRGMIRGRKYYWHFNPKITKEPVTLLNSTMRSLKKGDFTFDVFYKDLTKQELEQLVWTLTINGNKSNNCHKIGHAKPLGYGSVKITVESITQRTLDLDGDNIQIQYQKTLDVDEICKLPEDMLSKKTVKDYLTITQFDVLSANEKEKVSYPYLADDAQKLAFKWFQKNSPLGIKHKINQILPEITDANHELK